MENPLDIYLASSGDKLTNLAERSSVGMPQLSRFRRGRALPNLRNAILIEDATQGGVTPRDWYEYGRSTGLIE